MEFESKCIWTKHLNGQVLTILSNCDWDQGWRVCRTCLPIGLNAYFSIGWQIPNCCRCISGIYQPGVLSHAWWFVGSSFVQHADPHRVQSVMVLPVFGRNRPEGKILETVGVFEAVKQHGKYETGQVRPSQFLHAYTEAGLMIWFSSCSFSCIRQMTNINFIGPSTVS